MGFIKDIQDSKYQKIEEAIDKLNEQLEILSKDETDPKAREIFHEAARTLEMANPEDLTALGETMFQDMHECPEKEKEVVRLKEVQDNWSLSVLLNIFYTFCSTLACLIINLLYCK